ncbi:PaeR7I family type II restriction endonuclease [Luedemannella helvata]|uniref:Restriction endonuclease XhoI n=1 Tax=Luedemannella helvata TaxID=349315 RepID=A0ABP4XCB1_9ACTN
MGSGGLVVGEHPNIIVHEFISAGFDPDCVRRNSGIHLPGYYRPAKKWAVVVVDSGLLVAAIEFKSHVGPSFGNNFNNRIEEAIGSAVDVWRAYEEGTFGEVRPWLGYFFLLEDAPRSTKPVSLPTTVFPVDDAFQDSSYTDRYRIFCQRLLRERLYDAACFLTASGTGVTMINEPSRELGFAAFAAKIAGRAAEIHALKATGIHG